MTRTRRRSKHEIRDVQWLYEQRVVLTADALERFNAWAKSHGVEGAYGGRTVDLGSRTSEHALDPGKPFHERHVVVILATPYHGMSEQRFEDEVEVPWIRVNRWPWNNRDNPDFSSQWDSRAAIMAARPVRPGGSGGSVVVAGLVWVLRWLRLRWLLWLGVGFGLGWLFGLVGWVLPGLLVAGLFVAVSLTRLRSLT